MKYTVIYLRQNDSERGFQWFLEHFDTEKQATDTARDIADGDSERVYYGQFTVKEIVK